MNGTDPTADRVLILGGGLAGVACAQKLGDEGIDVVLVDRNDYHQFQPLLYQVASSQRTSRTSCSTGRNPPIPLHEEHGRRRAVRRAAPTHVGRPVDRTP